MQTKRPHPESADDLIATLKSHISNYEENKEEDISAISACVTELVTLSKDNDKPDLIEKIIREIEAILEESDLILELDEKSAIKILQKYLAMHNKKSIRDLFFHLVHGDNLDDDTRLKRITKVNALALAAFSPSLQKSILNQLAMQAAEDGTSEEMDQLLTLGANPNTFRENELEEKEKSLLMIATTQEILECLIKKNVDLNWQNKHGETALIYCVKKHNEEDLYQIKVLLEAKADTDLKDEMGKTALAYAVAHLDVDSVKTLILASDASIVDNMGHGLFHELARLEVASLDDTAIKRMLEIAALLKLHKVDINGQNIHGCTPLMEALKNKNTALVKFFIEQGCDLSLVNAFGNSAHELAYLYHNEALTLFHGSILSETDRMKLERCYGYFPERPQDIEHATTRILVAQKMALRKKKEAPPFYAYTLKYEELNEFYLAMKDIFELTKWDNLRIFILVTTCEVDSLGNINGAKHWRCMDFLFTKDSGGQKQAKAFVLEPAPVWHNFKQPVVEPLQRVMPDIKVSTNVENIQYAERGCAFMALDHLSQSSTVSNFHEQLAEPTEKPTLKKDAPKHTKHVELPLKFLRSTQSLSALYELDAALESKTKQHAVNTKGKNFLESVQQHTRFRRNKRIDNKFIERAKDYYRFIKEHSASAIDKTVSERGFDGFKRLHKFLKEPVLFVKDWKSVMLFEADREQKEEIVLRKPLAAHSTP